jgi:hypothetical protein
MSERDHLEDLELVVRMLNLVYMAWTEPFWLRIEINGVPL